MDILLASARNVTQGESVVDIWWLLWRIGHWIDTL
jgi:hypothetical protein